MNTEQTLAAMSSLVLQAEDLTRRLADALSALTESIDNAAEFEEDARRARNEEQVAVEALAEARRVIKAQNDQIARLGGLGDPEVSGPSGGAVESEHGPCEDGGTPVRDLLWMIDLQDAQSKFIEARLAHGEKPENYGKPLCEGWTRARAALEEELADGIAYALAAQEEEIAQSLANAWAQLNAPDHTPETCSICGGDLSKDACSCDVPF